MPTASSLILTIVATGPTQNVWHTNRNHDADEEMLGATRTAPGPLLRQGHPLKYGVGSQKDSGDSLLSLAARKRSLPKALQTHRQTFEEVARG